jgi:hypothetical protein
MKKNFLQQYGIIYKKYSERVADLGCAPSARAFSKFLRHPNPGKVNEWKRGQRPTRDDCLLLKEKLGFSLDWLLTGEGEMLDSGSSDEATISHVPRDILTENEASVLRMENNMLKSKLINASETIITLQRDLLVAKEEVYTLYMRQTKGIPLSSNSNVLTNQHADQLTPESNE